MFGQTPSDFRKKNREKQILSKHENPKFSAVCFEETKICIAKITIASDITYEGFYEYTKLNFNKLNINTNQWILLWNEDLRLSKVSESRYFIGIDAKALPDHEKFGQIITLKGKYAIFEATELQTFDYKIWAELAYQILASEGIKLREESYVEWFSSDALCSLDSFFPHTIAIPIQ